MAVQRKHLHVAITVALALATGSLAAKTLLESGAAVKSASESNGVKQARARANAQAGIVPFLGPFKLGMCGPSVRLMEGALRHTKPPIRKTKAQACFGAATRRQVIHFQQLIHYKPTGVYNLATHLALVKRHAYTQQARRDLLYTAHLIYVRKVRAAILTATEHAERVGPRLPYSQSGSRSNFPPWPRIPPATDCSGYSTWVLWQGGIGLRVGYPPSVGWTGSLVNQGVYVSPNSPLKIGDLVFYGYGRPWGHVAVYVGHGRVSSHGSVGVKNLPYNYRAVGEVRRYIS